MEENKISGNRFVVVSFVLLCIQAVLSIFIDEKSVGLLVIRLLFCIPALILVLISKTKFTYRLICAAAVIMPIITPTILGDKISIITDMILTVICVVIIIRNLKAPKEEGKKYHPEALILFLMLFLIPIQCALNSIKSATKYSFLNGNFPLWQGVIIASVALGVTVTVIAYKRGAVKKKFWGSVGYFFLGTLLSFAFLWISVSNLNHALDFSEPEHLSIVIEEKEINSSRRSPDSYEFEFSIDGKKHDVPVSKSAYDEYNIGDKFNIEKYNGAFDCPYFIAEIEK